MTWNVEDWFIPGGSAGVTDLRLWGQKRGKMADTIMSHQLDVFGFREVGDPAALGALKTKLGARYPHLLIAAHFDAMHPIRVGRRTGGALGGSIPSNQLADGPPPLVP